MPEVVGRDDETDTPFIMRFAFCLFDYFPHGGLQSNFYRILEAAIAAGHSVDVYAKRWDDASPAGASCFVLPARGWSNHRRCRSYVNALQTTLRDHSYDAVVGFNRIPGVDIYYAADVCYEWRLRNRPLWLRWLPRYRLFSRFEREIFDPSGNTRILYLSEKEKRCYQKAHGTPDERFGYLPPGLDKNAIRKPRETEERRSLRKSLGLADSDILVLMVGSDFRRKGVDRSILALTTLPEALRQRARLWIIGRGHRRSYVNLARRCGVADRVAFLGTRGDVPRFLAAADGLLHPARSENTGNAILEAMVAGLPVMATATCGYACHVERAQAGKVLPEPFDQKMMNAELAEMLSSSEMSQWGRNAYRYADTVDFYSRPTTAVAWMETWSRSSPDQNLTLR